MAGGYPRPVSRHGTRLQCPRRLALMGVGLATGLLAAGCSAPAPAGAASAPATSAASSASASGTATVSAPATSAARPSPVVAARRRVSKILVIMEENHSLDLVFPSGMPYLWNVARAYGRATAWTDVSHPSLPNYLAIFAGSIFDNPQDCSPGPGCQYAGPTVFGQAIANGRSARSYEESMPTPCDVSNSGDYDVNHNPWAYFPGESGLCQANNLPAGTVTAGALASDLRAGTLPNVGLITPNLMHDGHDGTLAQADAWLSSWMRSILAGPDWLAGRLAVVVVFDEGETTETVPFVILAPGVSGAVITRPLNHYSLTLLIDQVAGVAPLRHAAGSPAIADGLGLNF